MGQTDLIAHSGKRLQDINLEDGNVLRSINHLRLKFYTENILDYGHIDQNTAFIIIKNTNRNNDESFIRLQLYDFESGVMTKSKLVSNLNQLLNRSINGGQKR